MHNYQKAKMIFDEVCLWVTIYELPQQTNEVDNYGHMLSTSVYCFVASLTTLQIPSIIYVSFVCEI